MTERTVLVTGGAGFVGVPVVRQLLAAGHHVVVLDNFCVGTPERLLAVSRNQRLQIVEGDIRRKVDVEHAFSVAPVDSVVHLAAHHFIPFCIANPAETIDVNVTGTQVVIDVAEQRRVAKFVFASTADVYSPAENAHRESDQTLPNNVYGASKLMGEQLLRLFADRNRDVETVVARLFNVYGPGETNPHLLPDIMLGLRASNDVFLGNAVTKRDYIFTEDLARTIANLVSASTGQLTTLNVGSGKSWTAHEIVELLGGILGRDVRINLDPSKLRPVDRPHLRANTELLHALMHDQLWTSIEDGLRATLAAEGLLSGVLAVSGK